MIFFHFRAHSEVAVSCLYLGVFYRFFDMVNRITEDIGKNTEEGECDGDSVEVRTMCNI